MEQKGLFGWLVGAAGLTGALVGLGYVVRFAQGELLGVSTYDPDRAGYVLAAGEFILQTMLLLLHWSTLLALLLIFLIASGLELARRLYPRIGQGRSLLALVLILVAILHVFYFIFPVIPIRNTMFQSVCLDNYFGASWIIKRRTQDIWKGMVCGRNSNNTIPECGSPAPGEYLNELNSEFRIAVLLMLGLWLIGWRVLSLDKPNDEPGKIWLSCASWEAARALFIGLLILDTVGVAYAYGKTIRSTKFSLAAVEFAEHVLQQPNQGGSDPPAADRTRKEGSRTADEYLPESSKSLIVIAGNSDNTVFYDSENDRIWMVRTAVVNKETISSQLDILELRIKRQAKSLCKGGYPQ